MAETTAGTGRVAGKVVLITGGARGQGAAEGRLLASEGATVVLTDLLDDAGETTAAGIGAAATYLHHDVTRPDDWRVVVDAVLAQHGRIDVLVNNAGIFRRGPLLQTTYEEYLTTIEVNQHGTFLGLHTVAPVMRDQRAGSIINISSVAGLQGVGGFVAYGASKWAVRGLTRSAAQELAPFGVRVNSVHPGLIDTAMLDIVADGARAAMVRHAVPMGREASADEVAKVVLFLASDDSAYSTGAEFVVDGGMTA